MARPLTVTTHRVCDPRWTLPPLAIAFLSDLHPCRPWLGPKRLAEIVVQTNRLGADLILLGGDYLLDFKLRLVSRPVPPKDTLGILADLTAPLGVFGILGNHDWGDCRIAAETSYQVSAVLRAHAVTGVPLLRNSAVEISWGERSFWLVGTDSQRAVRQSSTEFVSFMDKDTAFADVPDGAPAIHLAHEPDCFADGDDRAFLQLSGHTHGGQIKVFGRTPVVPSHYGSRYVCGYYQENGNHLVVSRGIGTSGVPLRVGVPPEIVLVEIKEEEDPHG